MGSRESRRDGDEVPTPAADRRGPDAGRVLAYVQLGATLAVLAAVLGVGWVLSGRLQEVSDWHRLNTLRQQSDSLQADLAKLNAAGRPEPMTTGYLEASAWYGSQIEEIRKRHPDWFLPADIRQKLTAR